MDYTHFQRENELLRHKLTRLKRFFEFIVFEKRFDECVCNYLECVVNEFLQLDTVLPSPTQ